MESFTIQELVMMLIGNVESMGSTHIDRIRLENLKNLGRLTEELVFELGKEVPKVDRHEFSMKESGKEAMIILKDLREMINNQLLDYETAERR